MVEQDDWKARLEPSNAEPGHGALLDVRAMFAPAMPVIRLRGELDLRNVHQLHDAVDRLAAADEGGSLVVVDLEGLGFCDANGLKALQQARHKLAQLGMNLLLRNPSEQMRQLLEDTGLAAEFQLAP